MLAPHARRPRPLLRDRADHAVGGAGGDREHFGDARHDVLHLSFGRILRGRFLTRRRLELCNNGLSLRWDEVVHDARRRDAAGEEDRQYNKRSSSLLNHERTSASNYLSTVTSGAVIFFGGFFANSSIN